MKDEVSEMLEEMRTGYPGVYHIILDERNVYLTAMLQATVRQPQKITPEIDPKGQVPPVVVAIVGIGHQAGIVELFDRSKFCPEDHNSIFSHFAWRVRGPEIDSGAIYSQ